MLYQILKPIAVSLFKVFFRLEVKGKENIPDKEGFVLASNHLSYLDPVALGVACPRPLNFMAKEELFKNKLFGLLISLLGAFAVKRKSADISALKEAIKRLKKGKVLVIFPQGTRKDSMNNVYGGVGFLVRKTKVGVVPAFIEGTDKAFAPGEKCIKFSKIRVFFGKIRYYQYQDDYVIAEEIMKEIHNLAKNNT